MSYSSRVYRQRNAHTKDENSNDAFFGKKHDEDKSKAGNFFQDRLTVNKPGDVFEKEADATANAIVNKTTPKPGAKTKGGNIQRLSTPAEDEKLGTNDSRIQKDKEIQEKPADADSEKEKKKPVQKMDNPEKEKDKKVQKMGDPEKEKDKKIQTMDDPDKEREKKVQKMDDPDKEKEKKKLVQTKQEGNAGVTSPALSAQVEESAGKGNPLPDKSLHEMNQAFGKDFSDVKIHNDSEAAEMNEDLNAKAFTHGKDIYFNEGKFDAENASGKSLLAHELTHVVQQNSK